MEMEKIEIRIGNWSGQEESTTGEVSDLKAVSHCLITGIYLHPP